MGILFKLQSYRRVGGVVQGGVEAAPRHHRAQERPQPETLRPTHVVDAAQYRRSCQQEDPSRRCTYTEHVDVYYNVHIQVYALYRDRS